MGNFPLLVFQLGSISSRFVSPRFLPHIVRWEEDDNRIPETARNGAYLSN